MKKNYILLVEDDHDISMVISLVLRSAGFSVIQAGNGQEALQTLDQFPFPALILLDLNMPVMDGWKFLENFKKSEFSEIPVVVSTASIDDLLPEGFSAFLRKPYEIESLLELIRKFCTSSASSALSTINVALHSTKALHLHEMGCSRHFKRLAPDRFDLHF